MSEQGHRDGVARRDVLKGLAGAGAVGTGIATDGREITARLRGQRYLVGVDPAAPEASDAVASATSGALSLQREIGFGEIRHVVVGWYDRAQRTSLRRHPAVTYVAPDQRFEPHCPEAKPEPAASGSYPWGIDRIGAQQAHENGYTGAGTDITIIDTGVTPSQYALAENVGNGTVINGHDCESDARAFDSVSCAQPWDDDQYHGTHVAGIAGCVDSPIRPGVSATDVLVDRSDQQNVVTGQEVRDQNLAIGATVETEDGKRVLINNGTVETEAGTNVETASGVDVIESESGHIVADEGAAGYTVFSDGASIKSYTDGGDTVTNVQTAEGTDVVPGTIPEASPERIAGVAPETTLHAANVFQWTQDQNGNWDVFAWLSDVAAAIEWATDQGHDVINASLGGSSSTTALEDALEYAAQNDVVFVASAGNSGNSCPDDDCVSYPAAHDRAVAVASTTDTDDVASSSSRGPEVDVGAPGDSILSATPAHVEAELSYVDLPFFRLSGTSMAAPHVAGLAALLKAHTSLSEPAEIRDRITQSAEDIGASDTETGAGLIDAQTALDLGPAQLTVSTAGPSSVTASAATLGGELTDLGGASEADVYFEYRTQGANSWQETSRETLSATGTFEETVTGLSAATTYEFRAAAEENGTTTTGATQTFTTEETLSVRTDGVSAVRPRSATLEGTLESMGEADTVAAAFEYWQQGSNDTNETLAETLDAAASYDIPVEELTPETTYEFRALGVADDVQTEGDTQTFTTEPTLGVSTSGATGVTRTEATLQGELDALGGADSATVLFEYRVDGAAGWTQTQASDRTTAGTFEATLTELSAETTYEFRAVAEADQDSTTGATQTFTTAPPALSVDTLDPAGVEQSEATLRADLTQLGGADTVQVFFEYGPEGGDTATTSPVSRDDAGTVETRVTALDPDTNYVYTAVAQADSDTATGTERSFETNPLPLSVQTSDAILVGKRTARLTGTLEQTGGADTVSVAFEYWQQGADTTRQTLAKTRQSTGGFDIDVEDLSPDTTYLFRAVATAGQDTDEGQTRTFTTDALPLSVETTEVEGVGEETATFTGELNELGAADTADVSFEYWEDETEERIQTPPDAVTQPGEFQRQVDGLTPETTYRVQAVAQTETETDAGDTRRFTTETPPLSVETGNATAVGRTSARLVGDVAELGVADAVGVRFEYWSVTDGENRRQTQPVVVEGPGTVEVEATGLMQDTAYRFQLRASADGRTDVGGISRFQTSVDPVDRSTVDATGAGTATFSQRGDGYRIRAAGQTPWDRPRDRHEYGAIYEEVQGDTVLQTTIDGLYGDHDVRLAGLVVSNDLQARGGLDGDLLVAVEPDAGVSLVVYDESVRRYQRVAEGTFDIPGDIRLTKRGNTFTLDVRAGTETEWTTLGSAAVSGANTSQEVGLFATGGDPTSRAIADFGEFRTGDTGIALLPSEWELAPGRIATFDVVVENANQGVQSYTTTVAVSDVGLASIEEISPAGDPAETSIDIRDDGSRATIAASMGETPHGPGDVTVAEVTVETKDEGYVEVTVPEAAATSAETGVPYDITARQAGTIQIDVSSGPPPVIGDSPPQDVDGDGLYEDVNGDGRFTVVDVSALMDALDTDVVQNNAEFFNFDESETAVVTLGDVRALYEKLIGGQEGATTAPEIDRGLEDSTETDG